MKKVLLAMAAALLLCSPEAMAKQYSLNYSKPSAKWMGSLPLGNGRLGAMVYGGTTTETIALNEVTLWSGQEDPDCNNVCGPEKLKEIREAFLAGDIAKGNDLGWKYLKGHGKSFGTHLPFGDIKINYLDRNGAPTGYKRTLDMNKALALVTYNCGGVNYTQEYFTSNPEQVLVVRLSADKKKQVSFELTMDMLRYHKLAVTDTDITIDGDARFDKNGEGGVKFLGKLKVIPRGGQVSHDAKGITVKNADDVVLIMDIRTDFHQPDYKALCENTVKNASAKKYQALKKAHVADYANIFNRMDVDFGGNLTADNDTEKLFADARAGKPSPAFDALFFQYGRYMLISSSRENSPLPANLQGVWNDNLACNMPWTCDYHLDINIEQNYWSSNIANMAETNIPLFKYLELLAQYGHETAKKVYGCDGWVTHTINNVWGDTAPPYGLNWGLNVTAGAWMATHVWAHYDFTQDKEWLRTQGYPLIKETAKFFMDYMIEDPKTGWLLTGPSISPENGFKAADGNDYCMSMMPTIDRAVVYDIYQACIKSSEILGVDADMRARLQRDIKKLPPYMIDDDGTLKEWLLDVKRSDMSHRHASHLLGLYPLGEISPENNPDLAKTCDVFLDKQTHHGQWEDTEWTRGNMINFYARLKNPAEAYASLVGLYTVFMRENLMTVSPAGVAGAEDDIFSFDATEAAVSGACEMVLQSYDGYLDFLPALPEQWKDGYMNGVCARGAIEANIAWKDGKVVSATLKSKSDKTVKCKINGSFKNIDLKAGKTVKVL